MTGVQTCALPIYLSWNLGLENAGDLRLADKSDAFGFALRGRTVTASVRVDF